MMNLLSSKKIMLVISIVLIAAVSILLYQHVFKEKTLSKKPLSVHATVLYAPQTLSELKSDASLIVFGEVVSQHEPSTFAVASYMEIKDTLKGKPYDFIRVYQVGQMNEETVMEKGKKYLLFLNDQENGVEGSFHIVGANHGLFYVDKKGNLYAEHELMQKELEDTFQTSVSYNKKKKSAFEQWLAE
ncbi:hypothetical protein [Paenibacillus paeoniae]|uniref:Uncharacterized protein n=1 Tax=Paenibacillus paeoniae TaxID=2292705 RepID=A0A371PK34_9BACL|nr:hypothetical protein [Paenibacillus paeoniae]REK76019.1 hypothetical protein DX130_02845 [Paenibacillus paeoniae]